MKKLYTLIVALIITSTSFAQAPSKLSYQAIVRDINNTLLVDKAVGTQISILQGSISGTSVYVEKINTKTNTNGLVTFEIGTGTPISGDFSNIDWGSDSFFLKTETDPTGGSDYTITGTSQMLSVPYALYAKTSGSSTAGPQGLTGPQGAKGDTGVTGAQGAVGPQGVKGDTGVTGAQGAVGPQGAKGDTGVAGAQGDVGPQGAKGDTGVIGAQGDVGPQGTKGDTGVTGTQGDVGPQGAKGDTGITGPQGAVGAQGVKGDTGVTGAQGDVGPQGAKGDTGVTGAQGNLGPQGAKGDTGVTGAQGNLGPQGAKGDTGATGLLSSGTVAGNTPYWNGSVWVTNSSNIHNNGANVGIGVVNPGSALEVAGTVTATGLNSIGVDIVKSLETNANVNLTSSTFNKSLIVVLKNTGVSDIYVTYSPGSMISLSAGKTGIFMMQFAGNFSFINSF